MQPVAGVASRAILLSSKAAPNGAQIVNSEAFWRKRAEDVAANDIFFHEYFNKIGKMKRNARKSSDRVKGVVDESNGEDDGDDEIWQALVYSRPEIEGSESDSDLEMADFDEIDADSSGDSPPIDEQMGGLFNSDEAIPRLFDDDEHSIRAEDKGGSSGEASALLETELQIGQQPAIDHGVGETLREKRRRRRNLPTFATTEEYAGMLDSDENEDF